MAHVFISYSHIDKRFATDLKWQVEDYGFSVWIDKRIPIGTISQEEIAEKLNQSVAVLLVITPNALNSEYVNYEWHFALSRNIPLIPIYLKLVDKLPYPLPNIQYVDFRDKRRWGKLFGRLKELEIENNGNSNVDNVEKINPTINNLLHDLKHKDVHVRVGAAKVLKQFEDDSAIDGLLQALRDKDSRVREEAAASLEKKFREDVPFALLVNLHKDKDAKVRIASATSLAIIATPEAISGLIEAALNDNYEVREACINGLEAIDWSIADQEHDNEYVASLEEFLLNCNEYIEEQASLNTAQSNEKTVGVASIQSSLNSLNNLLRSRTITDELGLCERIASILQEIGTPKALAVVEEWRRNQQT